MDYEPVVGIETHAQLQTQSKMFCRCPANYAGAEPNTLVCPVCLGMPGVLPVINERAVEYTVLVALALHCEISPFSKFDRKNYHYPDLVKGYQISQYDLPISRDGWIDLELPSGRISRVGIERVHLEEDTGKLIHVEGHSLIDFNRSGVPLIEVVTKPDLHSLEEVQAYLAKLRSLLRYLRVNSGNMEEGAMRFEANVSLRPIGSTSLGTKVEIKNLNSFRAVLRSLEFEIGRQSRALSRGEVIVQETMGWDDVRGVTFVQRSKEYAHDYRYFPEPDLPPLELSREWVESVRAKLPELPDAKRERFMAQYGLSAYDANLLTAERDIADYFEAAVAAGKSLGVSAKSVANWMTGELFRLLNETGLEISATRVSASSLASLIALVEGGTISGSTGKEVLAEMFHSGVVAEDIIAARGLAQISDVSVLEAIVNEVIATNPKPVAEYRAGKEPVLRFLIGQVMKKTAGKANPALAEELLRKRLRGE
ncbi:MAG: Asp-tRNA(Asn)/Glu-tRNA(Gln) amidotransferase subunit GatB [Chloroflexi bacterium]|nr:Asp-tRNA(Asn)/Glu-tRNA(Gln) amidotransferase subunit GatB [Chloroflexota bacterium]